ncbi:MAG: alanine racemase [Myxococcota bacterium]
MERNLGIRPTWVEVDRQAICANAARLGELARAALYAVVKANAYGHGLVPVARAIQERGAAAGFAVSLVEEGVTLREAGITLPILVMGPALSGGYDSIIAHRLDIMLSELGDIDGLARAARARDTAARVHLKLDTGMGRLGLSPRPDAVLAALDRVRASAGVEVVGLASHLACADSDDPDERTSMTRAQSARFADAVTAVRAAGEAALQIHLANSAATLRFAETRHDAVRCGLALYGNGIQPATGRLGQAARLVSHIAQIRTVAEGGTVSYGALWRAPRPSRLAVVPIGYGDGLPRRATGRAEVLIGGRRCPVVGAICMDITLVDVSDLRPSAQIGDPVVILGTQGEDTISTAEFARWAGLLEYEVTCGLSPRVPRRHL